MTEDPQFDLDSELLVSQPEAEPQPDVETVPPPQAAPVVMIQYRNRGVPPILLFPITLILSLGMFAAYHYLFVAPRQRELQEQARLQAHATSAQDAVKAEPVEATLPETGLMGLSLDSQPLPPGFQIPLPPPSFKEAEAVRVAAKPVDASGEGSSPTEPTTPKTDAPAVPEQSTVAAESRKEAASPPAIGFSPASDMATIEPTEETEAEDAPPIEPDPAEVAKNEPVVAAVAAPDPKPSPTRDEMMRALEAEAKEKRLARADQNMGREQARERVAIEAQDRVLAERPMFHQALNRIIGAGGSTADAGQQIDALCEQFGRTYGGDLKAQVLSALSRFHGKISRDDEVNMMRSLGVPEAGILDYLANRLEHRSINARNGPRSQDGVRVLAAKQLLRAKLPTSPPQGGSTIPGTPRIQRARPASSVGARRAP